jgi:hypothetical protein
MRRQQDVPGPARPEALFETAAELSAGTRDEPTPERRQ